MRHTTSSINAPAFHRGFTLLELLIAVSVFAIMAVMAYGGLSNVISNSTSSEKSLERLHQVQLAMLKISRDFNQLSKRSIRDEYGNSTNYLMTGQGKGQGLDTIIEFSRGGRPNPAELLRSHLQRVAYKLEDNTLTRLDWKHLDRAQQSEPHEAVLLDDVDSVELRYLDSDNQWHPEWPPLNEPGSSGLTLVAIEFKLVLKDWGELVRLYRVET
jgi:general secretion pathway protein J